MKTSKIKGLVIRKANIFEISKIVSIQKTHFIYSKFWLWLLRSFLTGHVFVALKNNNLAGFIIWNNKTLCSIVVSEAFRGQGVGKELVNETMPGTDIQIVECSLHNKKFYEKSGFKVEKLKMVKR